MDKHTEGKISINHYSIKSKCTKGRKVVSQNLGTFSLINIIKRMWRLKWEHHPLLEHDKTYIACDTIVHHMWYYSKETTHVCDLAYDLAPWCCSIIYVIDVLTFSWKGDVLIWTRPYILRDICMWYFDVRDLFFVMIYDYVQSLNLYGYLVMGNWVVFFK